MDIKLGELFVNDSFMFLSSIYKIIDRDYVKKINQVFKLGIGLNDYDFIAGTGRSYTNHLFMLVDTKGPRVNGHYENPKYWYDQYVDFVRWAETKPYYETRYFFDDIEHARLAMVVFRLPYKDMAAKLLEGKFSELYPTRDYYPADIEKVVEEYPDMFDLKALFKEDSVQYRVVSKKEAYGYDFLDQLVEEFGSRDGTGLRLTIDDLNEYRKKPDPKNEIFNYTKEYDKTIKSSSKLMFL